VGEGGGGVVVREGVGAGGRKTQALYAHMNNKTIEKKRTVLIKQTNKNSFRYAVTVVLFFSQFLSF
jgi:F0F1-type ATP synthase beta subunit